METLPTEVDPLMIPQRIHPVAVVGNSRPKSPRTLPMRSGGMNMTSIETMTMIA